MNPDSKRQELRHRRQEYADRCLAVSHIEDPDERRKHDGDLAERWSQIERMAAVVGPRI